MTKTFRTSLFKFRNGSEQVFLIADYVADYFGIECVRPEMMTASRQSYEYHRSQGFDMTNVVKIVPGNYSHQNLPRLAYERGRKIRVPTGKLSLKQNLRTYTITFPNRAKYIEIGEWLYLNCKKHCPHHFLGEAGGMHPVDSPYLLL